MVEDCAQVPGRRPVLSTAVQCDSCGWEAYRLSFVGGKWEIQPLGCDARTAIALGADAPYACTHSLSRTHIS